MLDGKLQSPFLKEDEQKQLSRSLESDPYSKIA